MGTWYYTVCHTCRCKAEVGKKMLTLDPKIDQMDEAEIQELGEIIRESDVTEALAKIAAFLFDHSHHDVELTPDHHGDEWIGYKEVLDSNADDPFAYRRIKHEPPPFDRTHKAWR